jgi:hypothetical protein
MKQDEPNKWSPEAMDALREENKQKEKYHWVILILAVLLLFAII